ncbi:sigma-54-dependent transcriptional regulator [Qipengyuania soli]|uniref:Sigma-54-dependent Fis family transcriptional regulator n=1 Tax=Qipengyuania soli TaxID=2782568 RepID=A0A7S8ITR0_9SPHN|nr:response regulator [Qipengyuania soli]QPC98134.1 sigma-54-dependent Fis family transcriptional regulator [Qipengyuania soli]
MTDLLTQVLLVEDDDALRASATQALELEGFAVAAFAEAETPLRLLTPDYPGVVVSDVRLPKLDGLEFFQRMRAIDSGLQVIFTTAHGDIEMAVGAMRDGAADFFTKPYSIARLAHAVRQALRQRALVLENRKLRAQLDGETSRATSVQSAAARRLEAITDEVARTDADLLLRGGPGSGKSHRARQIHERSARSGRAFVTVDPGLFANAEADLLLYGRDPSVALSRSGMIERANGGTLVLEDIDQIPFAAQARLASLVDNRSFLALGAPKPRSVDLRIIATARDGSVLAGNPLAERLTGITISLPSLGEMREDIPSTFRRFVSEFEREFEREAEAVTEAEWHHLLTHSWPGNFRELRMYAQNLVLGLTRMADTGEAQATGSSLRDMLAAFERTVLEDALAKTGGNVGEVQRALSIPRKTLYDKLGKHGILPAAFRDN